VVDDDTNPQSCLGTDIGLLQFGKSETTALTDLGVVPYSLAPNGRAEGFKGAGTENSCLGTACSSAAELAAWLVEPGAYTTLPILSEVVFVEDCLHPEPRNYQTLNEFRPRKTDRCCARNPSISLKSSKDVDE
jgi:hypothetical protein